MSRQSANFVPAGSLVRSTNALYRKLGVGRVQKVRDGHDNVVVVVQPSRLQNGEQAGRLHHNAKPLPPAR